MTTEAQNYASNRVQAGASRPARLSAAQTGVAQGPIPQLRTVKAQDLQDNQGKTEFAVTMN